MVVATKDTLTVVAVLEVSKELFDNGEFTSEMGWVSESGIYLSDYSAAKNIQVAFENDKHCLVDVTEEEIADDNTDDTLTVVAVLEVSKELYDNNEFEMEMGWVSESGIYLLDYSTDKDVQVAYRYGEHCIVEAVEKIA